MEWLDSILSKVGLGFIVKDEPTQPNVPIQNQPKSETSNNEQPTDALWQELMRLVYFDTITSNRLLTMYNRKYPNQSHKWIVEKIILDLQRDRN